MIEPNEADVHCPSCLTDYRIDLNKLRAINDGGGSLACEWCLRDEMRPPPGMPDLNSAVSQVLLATDGMSGDISFPLLAVYCWRRFPKRFALKGHPEHADSHRLAMELTRLVQKRYFKKVRPCVYQLTPLGRAKRLQLLAVIEKNQAARARNVRTRDRHLSSASGIESMPPP